MNIKSQKNIPQRVDRNFLIKFVETNRWINLHYAPFERIKTCHPCSRPFNYGSGLVDWNNFWFLIFSHFLQFSSCWAYFIFLAFDPKTYDYSVLITALSFFFLLQNMQNSLKIYEIQTFFSFTSSASHFAWTAIHQAISIFLL